MADVRRSEQAEVDLEAILTDLIEKNPAIAKRYAVEFEAKHQALAQFPEIGRLRPEIAPNLRSTLVYPYVLFYRLEQGVVQIIRILHGKMDLQRIMREETQR